jgi:hypothetical protein
MVTDIVIPVRDQLEYTKSIVNQLKTMPGWNHCWIFDNGSVDDTWDWLKSWSLENPRFSVLPAKGVSIYEMWDWGFHCARFSDHVLFLNNDVKLHPQTIVALNNALESDDSNWIAYPDYNANEAYGQFCNYRTTKGTYRHGGMSGYCFMLKTKKITWSPLVDLAYHLWYGDDDLAFHIEQEGGKQVRVIGLPIQHIGQATSNHHPELQSKIPEDREYFISKWGNR